MLTGITHRVGTLVGAILVLSGAAILSGGVTAADPNQDEQFLALLDSKEIPALENVPSLIATAHKICRKLDAGVPVDDLVDAMRKHAFNVDSTARLYPPDRVTTTIKRFISAAVEAYCPHDQGKIASIMANFAPGSSEPTHRVVAYPYDAVNSENNLRQRPRALGLTNTPPPRQEPAGTGTGRRSHWMDGGAVVAGRYGSDRWDSDAHDAVLASLIEAAPAGHPVLPNPPQIPTPPPPTAQTLAPPPPIVAPQPPKRSPPPPHQPPQQPPQQPPPQEPPPPQQPPPPQAVEQPADAPQSGGGVGGGGSGGNGGGGPVEPLPPPRPMPPGFVRLAP
ncbi:DUF732 domain-containing protein [Mycobacterium shinjukuense]|uniref:Uncharacterized protein n=1 Tax=Mycobacterium shinjukuense TaxID=398694 RepID=A0A7I7MTY7_9MYCO|nr:DUF732 domain-containing protein [Mycobacterium shinjukuense]MCV6986202.1 DUF732 domain-containing protein [Mycobacterium shinjukuense]ORB72277.1 hypothetical protein BST45_00300 [Mycobacterium shinjukuense]BBX75302.1 hypothetical protein MSHI_32080 [Mycobacterium shinjukuense]